MVVWRYVPDADLAVIASGEEVRLAWHHEDAGDTVRGGGGAPHRHRDHQVTARHHVSPTA